MVMLRVPRQRAQDLLAQRIEDGRSLGDRLAKEINSDAAYTGWIHDKERWKRLSLEVLDVVYGGGSKEWKELEDSDRIFMVAVGTPWHVEAERALERHASSLNVLQSLVERLDLADELPRPAAERKESPVPTGVFVVHGHDEVIREQVARTIEQVGRKAVILHEQANKGQTIIEKFERHAAEAGWAVILLTADDVGGTSKERLQPRARQNVVLEMGFFYGRLGRERVAVLYGEGVELPSDALGIAYIPIDAAGAWKVKMLRELDE
jgi:predicted nucleotide-binding protein